MKEIRLCPICKTELEYHNKYNLIRAINLNKPCKPCSCRIRNKTEGYSKREKNSQWKGYNEIPYNWFSGYFERGGGRNKNRTGNINIQDVYNMWIQQNKSCKLTGLPIGFYDDEHKHTCSIDRIDSLKEYTIDNIQLVHKHINKMKMNFNNEYFIEMCKKVANNNL